MDWKSLKYGMPALPAEGQGEMPIEEDICSSGLNREVLGTL